ncbi:MAG: hypothetical protein HC915_04175 [Anaerolineae bacterium]|nr:hypothetical protein [Anaerolineae bacterium]
MSQNLPNLQDFSAESFGTPQQNYGNYGMQQPPKKRNTTRNVLLIGCGVVSLSLLGCICCCLALVAVTGATPLGAVGFWGVGGQADAWSISENFVCDGSQAARLTDFYDAQGYSFTSFSFEQDTTMSSDQVRGEGFITVDGDSEPFEAMFTTSGDGGLLGTCIERIDVVDGPRLGN